MHKMAKFYNPKLIEIRNIPLIVYPDECVEKLLSRNDPDSIKNHLGKLYLNRGLKNPGVFNIDILWKDQGDLMTDVWMYSQLDNWGSGAFVDAKTFRKYKREISMGVSAEFGLIMLGREAGHRIGKTLQEYLKTRPELPAELINGKDFYIREEGK
jgi:hypothetical protein